MTQQERDELLIRLDERTKRIEDRMAKYEARCNDLRHNCVTATEAKLKTLANRLDGLLGAMTSWRTGALVMVGLLSGIGVSSVSTFRAWLALILP